jgi:D-alanine-D-alanine ligase
VSHTVSHTVSLAVAVIQGGPSSEAEVSRRSAKAVAEALRAKGHRPVLFELDRFLADSLRGFDLAFPVVHGAVGEDGCLQGVLEWLEVPYVGSGVLASALAMDKAFARRVFAAEGLPVAAGVALSRGAPPEPPGALLRRLSGSVVVKPCRSGSAIGVSRLPNATEEGFAEALADVWKLDDVAIVEELVAGREITCAVLDLDAPAAFPVTEIAAPNDAFYTYEARYASGRSVHTCPAALPAAVAERVQEVAVSAHRTLGCRDLSRADFVVGEDGRVVLLEVNTMPGFTATSLYPEALAVGGVDFPSLCDKLVRRALARGPGRRNAPRPFPQ